ncbi:MAG: hypothetical protein B7Z68_07390 [Acidobacteria bacterium 21-70-11]|nr:MAG: hypothetical protein B7Z68_07390 [Acidobacteria bacterium 21-70-11]
MRNSPEPRERTNGRSREVAALLSAARALLENRAFADAGRAVLGACKAILGADAGFVAVTSPGGKGIEAVCLDPGSLGLPVAGGLPAPLRRLCSRAAKAGQVVIGNDLAKGAVQASPAGDHAALESALLAPIVIAGDVVGLVGLINKPGGFSARDSQLAEVFAEMAAVAKLNSSTVNGLEKDRNGLAREVRNGATHLRQAEEQFKTLVENLPDIIVRFDSTLRHLYASPAVRRLTGRPWQDVVGKTNRELGMSSELVKAWDAALRSLDRETVLATLLDHLRGLVPFDRAHVMLLEEASRISVRAIFDGNSVVPIPAEERPEFDPTDHPIVQSILTTGKAVLIPDVSAHPGWSLPTDRLSEGSWMGVPLFARGSVAGLFSLAKREAGYFNREHVRLAETMSSQASVAVENAILFEQMQASTARMQLLSRRLVEVQESERRNIARELHDEAGQALASLRFGLRLLEREIDEGGSVTGRVTELMQRTDAVIDGLHRLAADLRPASLDHLGLEAALRQYARSAGSKFGLTVRFKARGFTSARLPMAVETALYRVVQEAMTNVVRHAGATRVDVLTERRGDRVLVMVEDDGAGFEPDQVKGEDHFGLLGLKERAEALGGTLRVESAPGAGTTVVVEVSSADPHSDR